MACYNPVKVYDDFFRCGRCIGCRADQAREWAIRIQHESRMHLFNYFVTLTYDEEHLPKSGHLQPKDLQEFFKAVRRLYPVKTVSYFGCGEYGEETGRPHYHAVLFGPDFLDRRYLRDCDYGDVWWSPSLETCWPNGLSELTAVTERSAAYVAGYVRKKLIPQAEVADGKYLQIQEGRLRYVSPPFSRMSLRPAIGRRWIEKYWRSVYSRDSVVLGGKEWPVPRYYDKWMEQDHPKEAHECQEHQDLLEEVKEERRERYEGFGPKSWYELKAMEKRHRKRMEHERGGKL